MLSKNNYKERLRKMEQKKERFSIRKFSVGAASVLIGFFFMGVGSHTTVHADTVTPQVQTAKENNEATTKAKIEDTSTAVVTSEAASTSSAASTASSASKSANSKATSVASSAAKADSEAASTSDAQKETESAATKEVGESKATSTSSAASSETTHANGTGGYVQNGISVPAPTEPEASQIWQELNNIIKPMSKEDLAKLGLDENTYYESANNNTKWHAVGWVYLHNAEGKVINLGTTLYHNQDGTVAPIYDKNNPEGTWLYSDIVDALLNANDGDNDFYRYQITQRAFLAPIVNADMIYVHQGSTLTTDDIKKALSSRAENLTGLVSGDWVTDQEDHGIKVVDTSKVGIQTGAARLDYNNGTKTSVSIPVTVIGPEAKSVVNVNQGDSAPTAASVITNDQQIQTYFPGTTYSWKEVPKTDVPGTFDATVVTTWPDGQKTEVNTQIVIKQMYQIKDESKIVTRTIIDNVPKQDPITVVQKVNLTRQVTEEMSGKQLSATEWQADGTNTWEEYIPQAVEGYTPNPAKVASQVVTGDTENTQVVINYSANTLTQKINYVDRTTNNTISTQTVTGKADSDVPFTADIPTGWVADQEVPTTINFGTTDPAAMTIYIKHGTEAITDPADTTKQVTRTVNYVDPVTNVVRPLATQEATLTRTGEKDLVTGEVTYSNWSTADFEEVSAPAIAGYTVTNPDAAPAMTVDGNTQSSTVTFTYTANDQTQVVKFVDNSDHDNVVSQYDVNGKTGENVGLNVESHVPTNWVIADPTNIPTNVTFGPNGNAPITVYVKHGIEAITDLADTTKTVTRTINYLLPDKKDPETLTVQKATLTRTGEKDLVTGEVTYSNWSTDKFAQVNAPSLQGYYITSSAVAPAMTVTGDTLDSTVTFVYAASWHNQVISYVNKATNELVSTSTVTGRTGSTVNFTPQIPTGWVISEGQEVPTSVTFGTTDPVPITIYIQHGTQDITAGTTKTVTRSIYTEITGQAPMLAKYQNVTLHRTGAQDLVTGQITYGEWQPATFEAVTAPAISGYTVTNPDAAPEVTVNGETQNSSVIFTYVADEQTQNVKFVNNANPSEVISQYDVKGKSNTTANLNIDSHVPTNWVITPGQYLPTSVTFGTSDASPIVVYVQHGTKTITGTDDTTKKITRVVNYVDPTNNQTKNVTTQEVTLTRTGTQDLVTGEITYGNWNTSNFASVAAPTLAGYYAVGSQVAPAMVVTANTPDSTVTFHYAASWHNQVINYVDGNNTSAIISSDNVSGRTGSTVSYTPQVPAGWVIEEGQEVPTTITFGTADPAPITILIKHGTKEITNDYTSKTVTRTVNMVNPTNGQTEVVKTQSVTLTRPATQDLVTGDITYGNWNSANFDAVKAPEEAGYTVTNPDAAPAMNVTAGTQNSTVTFTYAADSHSQVINYVDNTTKDTVNSYDVNGKTGETVNTDVTSHVPTNWVIVPNAEYPTSITFGSSNPAPITVYVEHGTKDVTNDPSQKNNVSKTITRTVNAEVAGKTSPVATQTVTLNRTATEDLVTGEVTYSNWSSANFDAVKAPEKVGYTVTNPDAAPAMSVTANTQSSIVTFTYAANSHEQVINYVDNDNKATIVGSYNVTGKTGETVDTNIQSHVPTNWVIVPGSEITTQVTFGSSNPAPITVYVEHGTKDITNDQTTKTITRTVNYVNPVSGKTENVATQSATLTRPATEDLVTGEITYGAWNSTDFKAVAAPALAGYTVTNPDAAPAMSVTGNTQNTTVVFTYTANGQTATIEYVNADNQSQVVKTDTVNGKTGQTVAYKVQAPEGWTIVKDQTVPTQITFGSTQVPVTKILVKELQNYKYSVTTNSSFTTHVGATVDTPSLNPINANFTWTDREGNPIAAPTGYAVSWKQTPSTSAITDETGTLQITYSDGTTADVTVPVTVKGATAINGNKVYQGEAAPNARLAVNTKDISDFKLDSITWAQEPDTNVAGAEIPGVVSVNYSDGTSQLVNVTIDVIGVEKGIDHKDDTLLYRAYNGDGSITGTGSASDGTAKIVYTRNKLTDYAYPIGNPKHVTYTKWVKSVIK